MGIVWAHHIVTAIYMQGMGRIYTAQSESNKA